MNKKAQEEWLSGIPSLILIFIVLVIFAVFFIGCINIAESLKSQEKISGIETKESPLTLLNYLRTPINNIIISDMIIQKQNGIKNDELLIKETKEIFNKVYGICYELSINNIPLVSSAITRVEPEQISVTLPNKITVTLKPYYLKLLSENEKVAKEECKIE
mgnify:CR=1 FL=1